jgi:hypothetical protein
LGQLSNYDNWADGASGFVEMMSRASAFLRLVHGLDDGKRSSRQTAPVHRDDIENSRGAGKKCIPSR